MLTINPLTPPHPFSFFFFLPLFLHFSKKNLKISGGGIEPPPLKYALDNRHPHLLSPRCLTRYTFEHHGQHTHYHQTIYPSSPQLTTQNTPIQDTTIQTHLHQLQESRLDNIHRRHRSCFLMTHPHL